MTEPELVEATQQMRRYVNPHSAGFLTCLECIAGRLPVLFLSADSGNVESDTRVCGGRLTVAGTAPDSHRIPFFRPRCGGDSSEGGTE